MSTPQVGRPAMKALVPSIGSRTQHVVGVGADRAELLADDAVVRETGDSMRPLIASSAARSASVTGSKRPPTLPLSVGADGGAEERQDRFAGGITQGLDEGREIDG